MNKPYKSINFSFFILFHLLYAVSAPPHIVKLEQMDGTKIPVHVHGHEYYNWIETLDGYVIDQNENLDWCYSILDENGEYALSEILVSYPAPSDLKIPKHLKEHSPQTRNLVYNHSSNEFMDNDLLSRAIADETLKPLVLLVDFNDEEHEYTASQFQHLIFAENLSPQEANLPSDHMDYTMSVRDYYDEISNGKQQIIGGSGSVIDWQRADNEYSYYVDGAQGTGEGSNGISRSAASLIVEIAMDVDEEGFDFSQFDNGEGAIDVVILIVAGKGGQSDNYFWPHMFVVPSTANGLLDIDENVSTNGNGHFMLDGVVIQKYIVIQEKYAWNQAGAEVNMIHPIGTLCHELGHVLGLPDLYDTSVNDHAGIGEWGLMGSGNWQNQTSPAFMGAWSRYRLGYIEPIVLEDAMETHVDILPAGYEHAVAYILPMSADMPQEYILLENRQQLGADQFLSGSGLLAWHIDETITDMYPAINSVNVNPDFYGVNLLQADGQGDLYLSTGSADSTDPFKDGDGPLNGTSNPNTDLYDYDRNADGLIDIGGASNIEISNITIDDDGILSLIITNANKYGQILSYDEGNYEGIAFQQVENQLEWAGIKVVSPSAALFSGVQIVFPPSYSPVSNVMSYDINVWSGWSGNKPVDSLSTLHGNVAWDVESMRDGGYAFISFLEQNIMWERGTEYYVEVNYDGTGYIYFFDQGIYSNNQADGMSYYRSNIQDICIPLSSQSAAQNGDWNIRVVLSGKNCGVELGDLNGDGGWNVIDIVALVNCVLSANCNTTANACASDMNGDGGWNVVDVVALANCVLSADCGT